MKMEEELYNHLEICTFLFNGNTQGALKTFREKNKNLFSKSTLQIKKIYLQSLNFSIYQYVLIKEQVSLSICCHENEQKISHSLSSNRFLQVGEEIILAYGYCSEYMVEKYKNKHVKKAISYIRTHLDEPLTLDLVCDSINLNRCYLSDIFNKQVKCSFRQYILKQRIHLAKELLADSRLTIHLISEKCGFTSSAYFCTCFKKEVGLSPCAYRNLP
jgi:YesN/AraC family two-component response regulator